MLIGIAGASGSGKTTIANIIKERIGKNRVLVISMDNYYRDLSKVPERRRHNRNFDTPKAIDWQKLIKDVNALLKGKEIKMPRYSFVTKTWEKFERVSPREVMIIEGIFAIYNKELNKLMDIRLFVDTPLDICLLRRIKRDVIERKISIEETVKFWMKYVRPGYEKYVLPSSKNAHLVIPEDPDGKMRDVAIDAMISMIKGKMNL